MTVPARRLATYADLCALPDGTRAQLIAGEIRVEPAPLPEHQASLLFLA